jgi:tRNA(Ile)-lysidine synthase
MASLKKSTLRPRKNSNLAATINSPLKTQLASYLTSVLRPGQKLLLAFSGGLDSRVLLELLAELRSSIGFNLSAMHVHHGLSLNADNWAKFCSETCAALDVPIEITHVNVVKDSGLGLEASARDARYRALLNIGADYVVLAHHQDDQAETLLLQLLRGAGAKGLSGMAVQDGPRRLLRPLLDIPRAELLAFAEQRRLQWVTDESNDDVSYDRNYCRHEIFPILEKRFPAAKQTLARSASHLAEAVMLLDELAQIDLAQGQKQQSQKQLNLTALVGLPESRARNLLRWWLMVNGQPLPSTIRLQEMLRQLLTAKADARVKIAVNSAESVYLRRYQGCAYLESGSTNLPIALLWQGEAELKLPDNSRLIFEKRSGCGLAFKRLGINKLRITQRAGGERFKPDLAKPTRTLKHLLQEANMPPWKREYLPLIYCDDVLAVVPGIGVECTLQARADETGMMILWEQA